MGGRGAAGKWKTVSSGGGGKAPPFHEIKSLEGLTVREFEDKIRTSEHEYVGLVNKQGVVYLAGTSYQKGSVGIPVGHPDFKKSVGHTHNHPSSGDRMIGATFSGADVENMATFKHSFVRACASWPNENTYILRTRKGARHDYSALRTYAAKSEDKINRIVDSEYEKAETKINAKGKHLSKQHKNQIALGAVKKVWKSPEVQKAGFEYIEIKKKI